MQNFDRASFGYQFVGIQTASAAVNITCDSSDATMKKHVTVQVPMLEDEDEKDTDLVVVRCNGKDVQVSRVAIDD